MNTLRKSIAYSMVWLIAAQPYLLTLQAQAAPTASGTQTVAIQNLSPAKQGVELSGSFDDRRAELRAKARTHIKPGFAEDGTVMQQGPMATLPIVDDALSQKLRTGSVDEPLRVIVHLDFLPHAQIMRDVISQHQAEFDALENQRQALKNSVLSLRKDKTLIDAENYGLSKRLDDNQRAMARALADNNEQLSGVIKSEVTQQLRPVIEDSQRPIQDAIEQLGGTVEFTTIAGNMVIALMPGHAIEVLGKTAGIMRIVEDSMMEGLLTTADASTMVDPASVSMLGLWDAGQYGGAFDPAVIDSGIDLNHPGLRNRASPLRTNFYSWYLAAGSVHPDFDEFCCSLGDAQGHGTHVSGIVGSYGTAAWPDNLGMAFGVEKMVTLKAGWLNTSGRASMFWSDKYHVVDRALYDTNVLLPNSSFADDVDGMNLSYGNSTASGDTDGGRFWDSVISTYNNLPVTIGAGNSGPGNTQFFDPALSHNAITVANYSDRDTPSRLDDFRNPTSTVGPTAGGRKKPDIAAPGTAISSANTFWETQNDYVNGSGTSMAAPMVLGVIMDLMDAGLVDEVAIKAVLINTAQKNLPGLNFETDSDGWDEQLGWGAMNALAAYDHRFDFFLSFVTERDTTGEFRLFKGVMRDEGASGEGRDKATMVWNREATYRPDNAPTTFFSLSDLNMRMYNEDNNVQIDSDLDGNDNVQQVRINAGAGDTDVVIKPYAWSSNFNHGGTTQSFVLATEEDFVEVNNPNQFAAIASWPVSVEPSEVFDVVIWLRNDSEVTSHNNTFDLAALPGGYSLVAGNAGPIDIGSIAVGEFSSVVTYTLRAPNIAVGATTIAITHAHNSYGEPWGNFNWNLDIMVANDFTPPTPDPMTFATPPDDSSTTSIDMRATTASDTQHFGIQYYHQWISTPSGGSGISSSGWTDLRYYEDDGLEPNNEYCYREWARDNANNPNMTAASDTMCAYTAALTPTGVTFGNVTTTAIDVAATGVFDNLTLDQSALLVRNTTTGDNSGWLQSNGFWTSFGLTPAAGYAFDALNRNGDGDESSAFAGVTKYTLANPPAVAFLSTISETEIKVVLNNNGNSTQAEYFFQNTTTGANSGWINAVSYRSDGLTCGTTYNYQARARNGDGIETIIVPLGWQSTADCAIDTDGDGVPDSDDNCSLVANADQRDTNADGYGNICDPDLDNNGIVNFGDVALWTPFFNTATNGDADFNDDGFANFGDYAIFPDYFLQPPGPSGLAP